MQYQHNAEGSEVMKQLMGDKLWTSDNPFYKFSDVTKPIFNSDGMWSGDANQMFAKKLRKDVYELSLGFCFGYKKSTVDQASVLMTCQYNHATGKVTKVSVSYALGEYARTTTPMKTKRTGSIAAIYAEIATSMKDLLVADCQSYWKGFTEFYANRPQCGYYLD